jgi:hypothetical protein
LGDDILGKDKQQLVSPDDPSGSIHHSDPIGIAVKRDSEIGRRFSHLCDEVAQVLLGSRVRVVVREIAVWLGE